MIYIYCTNIKETQWSILEAQLNILDTVNQQTITQYKFDKDKCRALLGKMLLLHTLKYHEGYNANKLPLINYNAYQKPFITSMNGSFNISHAGDWVICAYAAQGEIGVDIEQETSINLHDYQSVMTKDEYHRAMTKEDFNFFQLWTLKEAIMKAEGLGFHLTPTSFEIPYPFTNNTRIDVKKQWYLYNQSFEGHYNLSIAASHPLNTLPKLSIQPISNLVFN